MKSFTISGSPALKKAFCEEAGLKIDPDSLDLKYNGSFNHYFSDVYFSSSIREENIHFHLPDDYKEALKHVKNIRKPKFEKGKAYIPIWPFMSNEIIEDVVVICTKDGNELIGYGCNGYGEWLTNHKWSTKHKWREATHEEASERLSRYAREVKGFKKGVKIKELISVIGSLNGNKNTSNTNEITWHRPCQLFIGNLLIMNEGEWAEIVEETYSIGDMFKDTTNGDTYILSEVGEDIVQLTCLEDGEAYLYGKTVNNRWKITTDEMNLITGKDLNDFEKIESKIKY